jgi:type VI secretion system secreted protein Hcp
MAMALYMNYNAKKIKGDVTAKGYEDWIDLSSMQFGVGRGIGMAVGSMSNREVSLPSISEITVSKQLDPASALLFKDSLAGSEGVSVEIAIVRTGAKEIEEVGRYHLENVLISSFSISSGGDRPTESLSLSFAKITVDLKGSDKANKNGENIKVGYDLALGHPV